jgi:tungstate transport system substrate-binding protein
MYNDFVIIGPKDDPAKVAAANDIAKALAAISNSGTAFVSRGDDSGTNRMELRLWKEAQIDPKPASGGWYREAGAGMGATLNLAAAMNAYTLSDRATWLKFANKGDLEILVEGDSRMFNQYGVILIDPEKHPHVKAELGNRFIDWLLSGHGQETIASYKIGESPAFFANAKEARRPGS